MKGFKTLLVIMLLLSVIPVSFFTPQVRGDLNSVILVPSPYTGSNQTYTPGETMDIVLQGDADDDNTYGVFLMQDNTIIYTIRSDVNLVGGEATVSYPLEDEWPDGDYQISARYTTITDIRVNFTIQAYSFLIETDRDSYLAGDEMKIFWTANNLKDKSLPPIGDAWINVSKMFNNTPVTLKKQTLNSSAGSFSYPLPSLILNYSEEYWVEGFFNDEKSPPERSQYARVNFNMKRLGVIIKLNKEQYSVGSLLSVAVTTVATDNQFVPLTTDTAEPGCDVEIRVYKQHNQVEPIEVSDVMQTDSHGIVKYIVALVGEDYTDGSDYIVEVTASKGLSEITNDATFRITKSSSLSVVLDFNKAEYTSGDSVNINASASSIGGGTDFTFLFEIRDANANGTLFSRTTQVTSSFVFQIPPDFLEGWLWIKVTVDDGLGNSANVSQTVKVSFAIVLVNVNRENYVASDVLTISYDVISEWMTNPETYYIVQDSEGYTVEEGVATGGTFTYTIPVAPSKNYMFTVIATQGGRLVQGHDTAVLFSSYVLTIEFDRNNYKPGGVMQIEYKIIALGDAILPATFTITYGLANSPLVSLQTSFAEGELTYNIPEGTDEGEQLFVASCDFGGDVNEVVTIKERANPLWYLNIGDIPIFNVLLFLLVLFLWFSLYRTRRKIVEVQKVGLHSATAEKTKRPAPEGGASVVECVECSNPIEITTSRRPIEVMCPHCGEIQHIER